MLQGSMDAINDQVGKSRSSGQDCRVGHSNFLLAISEPRSEARDTVVVLEEFQLAEFTSMGCLVPADQPEFSLLSVIRREVPGGSDLVLRADPSPGE